MAHGSTICLAHCCPLSFLSDLDAKAASSAWLLFCRFPSFHPSILFPISILSLCDSPLSTQICTLHELLQVRWVPTDFHRSLQHFAFACAHVPLPSFIFVNCEPYLTSLHFFTNSVTSTFLEHGKRSSVHRIPWCWFLTSKNLLNIVLKVWAPSAI